MALCKGQTARFINLARGFEGTAKVESEMRVLRRFNSNFVFDNRLIARFLFNLLPEIPPYRLCLTRINWKYGMANISYSFSPGICECFAFRYFLLP